VLRHTTAAFSEDPLRVMRAVGFAGRFGFRLADDTAALCRELVDTYGQLSVERIWTEWHKIAAKGTHLSAALAVLVRTGWDVHFPQLSALRGLEQDPRWHPEGDVFTHAGLAGDQAAALADDAGLLGDDRVVVVLAALLHDVGKVTHTRRGTRPDGSVRITSHGHDAAGVEPARAFLRGIGAPKHIRDRVLPIIAEHMVTASTTVPTRAAVRRLARRLQPATTAEWGIVVEADKGGRGAASRTGESEPWMRLARGLGTLDAPGQPLLRGEHLIAAGLAPGPHFAPILKAAVVAQDDGRFVDTDGAQAWLADHLDPATADVGETSADR
jgi:tRNA nucleotidyltransferase (CCA-adding enzyme)